jgi:integrase
MTFKKFLKKQGLSPSTVDVYLRINRIIPTKAIKWLQREIEARKPISTLMVRRSVIKFRLMHKGHSESEAMEKLPKIKGIKPKMRNGLSARQLKRYEEICENIKEPFRTILLMLHLTGFRINEICTIQMSQIKQVGNRYMIELVGKGGKPRSIPLNNKAQRLLTRYVKIYQPTKWLFEGRKNHIKPSSVRNWTLKIQRENPELSKLSPHVLRHTFATMLHKKEVSPLTIQMLMGHSDLKTTQRYIHPTIDDLITGIDKL